MAVMGIKTAMVVIWDKAAMVAMGDRELMAYETGGQATRIRSQQRPTPTRNLWLRHSTPSATGNTSVQAIRTLNTMVINSTQVSQHHHPMVQPHPRVINSWSTEI